MKNSVFMWFSSEQKAWKISSSGQTPLLGEYCDLPHFQRDEACYSIHSSSSSLLTRWNHQRHIDLKYLHLLLMSLLLDKLYIRQRNLWDAFWLYLEFAGSVSLHWLSMPLLEVVLWARNQLLFCWKARLFYRLHRDVLLDIDQWSSRTALLLNLSKKKEVCFLSIHKELPYTKHPSQCGLQDEWSALFWSFCNIL